MKSIMTENIYLPKGVVAIVGACLPYTHPEGYALIAGMAEELYTLCLEETHINMAVTKIGSMLSTGRVTKLIFASVDRSPHCTQMHYIKHEIQRTMELQIEVLDYVIPDKEPILVSDKAIDISKSLAKLAEIY